MVFQSGCCRLPKTHRIFSAFTIIASKLPASTEGEAARSSSWLHAIKVPLCLRLWLKSISNHVPKTPKLTLPTAHASGPCFASTFTTPFGNFRISWDNNRTISFESVVSHQTKLDANQKKREVPSISKKETISIPPAYYLSFGKRLIITAIASEGTIQKKWPVTATSPPSAKRPLGHLDRLPVAPGSSHWPISIWPKLRVQAYHLSEVVSTGEKKIKMEHFFQIGWFQGDKMIKRETTWDRPKIVGSPPNLWQALKLHGLACRSHELVLCNEGRGDVIEKCLTQHKWIKTD